MTVGGAFRFALLCGFSDGDCWCGCVTFLCGLAIVISDFNQGCLFACVWVLLDCFGVFIWVG